MGFAKAPDPHLPISLLLRSGAQTRRVETHDGDAAPAASPSPRHQIVVQHVARLLEAFADLHGGLVLTAPLDLVLSGLDVVQPDVLFYSAERRDLIDLDRPLHHLPDIVVEVIAPETAADDRGARLRLYARHGVPEYWLVDPADEAIEIFRLERGRYTRTARGIGHMRVQSAWVAGLSLLAGPLFRLR